MTLVRLTLRNLAGNAFRSWTVFLCALVVAGLTLSGTLILRGAESSLRLALERLGADLVVVPQGSEAKVETALLMGTPTTAWMPAGNVGKLANTPGVAAASPQLYLASLSNASCCSASEMFVVALDLAKELLATVALADKMGACPRQLSAGQQQRVVIARSLINQPEVLLAEEPTSNLDEQTESEILGMLRAIHASTAVTILMVTHTRQLIPYGTRSLEMAEGTIGTEALPG